MYAASQGRWILLIHQIPPKPDYLRVKIWRRLQRLGAVALKNSVYVLPSSEQALEDLHWVAREIVEGKGDASICEARFVEGPNDEQIEAMFCAARDADYAEIEAEVRALAKTLSARGVPSDDARAELAGQVARLRKRIAGVAAIDFFGASGCETVSGLVESLAGRLEAARTEPASAQAPAGVADLRKRTWVTRKGVHVDRIASAWLIRRFIDPAARFKFVERGYQPRPGELRFDMFEGEFTHEGDRCTFETLLHRIGLDDRALAEIGEIVHDLDLKDGKFEREDAEGIERLITGIAQAHRGDEDRLARGGAMLDDLYEYFHRKRR